MDGSEQSKKAFDEAINIAKRNKGKLTLTTVIDTASFTGTTGGSSIPLMQEVHEKAQSIINELEQHRVAEEKEVHLTSQIIAGNPKREIVELADRFNRNRCNWTRRIVIAAGRFNNCICSKSSTL